VYKEVWTPVLGEELAKKEEDNGYDCYAVFIMMNVDTDKEEIVGHVSKEHSKLFCKLIEQGGSVICKVDGWRHCTYIPFLWYKTTNIAIEEKASTAVYIDNVVPILIILPLMCAFCLYNT